ncbi:Chromatin modification-related protein [Lachnellula subtilissima]|uniref:Chromatin modification-related protein n=1 Tax=Lachnellula subtilissima TaxID=602034 RepID=A0A8H8RHP4_9HELO|nr:Chromatin modification-related protein [Lachnellula subtilissima]
MAPKRKGKSTARAASTPVADEDAMVIDSPKPQQVEEPPKPSYDILNDPWTDEQETSLFKGIIKWKPAGMHKHFRMIALSEHLRNHGYDPTAEKHTRIPGIWQKLRTLYNLDILDERENSFDYDDGDDKFLEFQLPVDYEETMFMKGKRSPSEPPSSPSELDRTPSPHGTRKRKRGDTVTQKNMRASTIEGTDEPRTSPVHSSPPPKTTRTGRSTNKSMGRVKADSSSRQPSKDTTMDEEEATEGTEEGGDDDEAEEEGTPSQTSPKASKATLKSKADAAAKSQGASRKSKRKR